MADVTITGLPNASTLTGTERVPMDQSGTTVDAAASAIAALATKATVGLSNVDNTSDANKPVSTATQTALDAKATAGAIGSSGLTMTAGVLGQTGAGAPLVLSLSGLSIVNGVLTVTGGSNQAQTVTVAVRNNTGSTIAKGVPVYVTGSSGTTVTIAPADASTEATAAETLGLTTASIANNTDGTVTAVGLLDGLNTSALTEGQIVWLSETTGALTTTRPTQPAHGVVCGYCVKQGAGTSGILYIKIDNGLELSELHDVLVTGATAGQFLQLAADGLWKPRTFVATDISNSTTVGRALVTAASTAAQRSALELGTAAQSATGDFATAAQGTDAREWSAATVSQATAEAGISTTRVAYNPLRVFQSIAAYIAANFSATGQALATAASAAAARTTLGLGTLATQNGTFSGTSSGTNTGDQDLSTLLAKSSNLSDLANAATARTNLGLTATATATPAGGLSIQSGNLVPSDVIKLVVSNKGETATAATNYVETTVQRACTVTGAFWELAPTAAGSSSSQAMPYARRSGTKTSLLSANASLAASAILTDASANLTGTLTLAAGDTVGADLVAVGTGSSGHIFTLVIRYSS